MNDGILGEVNFFQFFFEIFKDTIKFLKNLSKQHDKLH